jgi:hypothetical protein
VKNRLGEARRALTIVGGEHKLALTPPLGWNSWNCWADAVSDRKVRAAADAMVASGLAAHGFQYTNIDDCWQWGAEVGGNCWRTTGDIQDTWSSMSAIGFAQTGHEAFAGPGHWNDTDMLVVGNVGWGPTPRPTRLKPHEQLTHITLWCLQAAPLLLGCDMSTLDDFAIALMTNDEVLDVSQDPLGKPAGRISQQGRLEVWARPLADGTHAVGLFNRGGTAQTVAVTWACFASPRTGVFLCWS